MMRMFLTQNRLLLDMLSIGHSNCQLNVNNFRAEWMIFLPFYKYSGSQTVELLSLRFRTTLEKFLFEIAYECLTKFNNYKFARTLADKSNLEFVFSKNSFSSLDSVDIFSLHKSIVVANISRNGTIYNWGVLFENWITTSEVLMPYALRVSEDLFLKFLPKTSSFIRNFRNLPLIPSKFLQVFT